MNGNQLHPESLEAAVLDMVAKVHRMRPATAAKTMDISRKRIESAINRLVDEGLVYTLPNPHDDRSKVVCLTANGHMQAVALRGVTAVQ